MDDPTFELKAASGRVAFRAIRESGGLRMTMGERILTISAGEAVALGEWLTRTEGFGNAVVVDI